MTLVTVLFIPVIIFTVITSLRVNTIFHRYNQDLSHNGLTGAEAAQRVLHANGITDVQINQISGHLTDHYNPVNNTLNLSPEVYHGASVAAIGVACHEAGHALQYATAYLPIKIKSTLVPVANFGARLSRLLITIGLLFAALGFYTSLYLAEVGVMAFGLVTIFELITLPTEFNASKRAIQWISDLQILSPQEQKGAKKVLRAAAMTYVAALAVSLLQLMRLTSIVKRHK